MENENYDESVILYLPVNQYDLAIFELTIPILVTLELKQRAWGEITQVTGYYRE